MGLLDIFRRSSASPLQTVRVGRLGEAVWSADDEAWEGAFEGTSFFVRGPKGSSEPDAAICEYAERMLLGGSVRQLVKAEVEKYAEANPRYAEEVRSRPLEAVDFYERKGAFHINCQLGYGAEDRFWSLEFRDGQFTGMGFDT